ncbi:hypothetical protein F2Q69_00043692 [Brassica cretica]|uniref:Uncharacterized protein n=1 Tax=Brassica cretica TaxID=69181 RepID=A0A8S9NKS2_BRACR|nr:hypothetical protein F2Q69_00043692 [Brassica cretica]
MGDSYIARRPEASASIDRRNNISTDIRRQTSVDEATNRGRLVPKVKSDMSDTQYHGEEISADTYATLIRHQFNLECLGDRLQRMENTTATMKEKLGRGNEAMRDFTEVVDIDRHCLTCHDRYQHPYIGRHPFRLLERDSRDEPSYICLPEHASLFTHTKLVPEIYTKDEINEMFYGICGAQEKYEGDFRMKLDGVYHPLNDSIGWLTTCMEEMSYIARRPEASTSIDRRNNISTDIRRQTSVDEATNRGQLVPKVKSDMSDTQYHGEEISADTYATLIRHQFNLESLGDRLQRMENTTATMKEKLRRRDEAMRDFTDLLIADSTKDTKVDQPVNYSHLLRLFEGTKVDLQH